MDGDHILLEGLVKLFRCKRSVGCTGYVPTNQKRNRRILEEARKYYRNKLLRCLVITEK